MAESSFQLEVKPDQKYTYADYLTWPEDERWEIIDGKAYAQAAPSWRHQSISTELTTQFQFYFRDKPCRVLAAPFDVFLDEQKKKAKEKNTVVQPDLVVICEEEKLKDDGYHGAPTIVVEIVSPSTNKKDRLIKLNRYEKAGVKEYWLVSVEGKFAEVMLLGEDGRYGRPLGYSEEECIKGASFPELSIDLKKVFAKV